MYVSLRMSSAQAVCCIYLLNMYIITLDYTTNNLLMWVHLYIGKLCSMIIWVYMYVVENNQKKKKNSSRRSKCRFNVIAFVEFDA